MTALAEAMDLSRGFLWLHFVVFLRVGPVIAFFPGFGEHSVPVRIRLMLALAMTAITVPAVVPGLDDTTTAPAALVWLILADSTVGLLLGIVLRLFLMALQTAGAMAAQSTSLSQILGSAGAAPLPAIGHVLVTGALALAMIMGLHIRLAEFIVLSYRVFPAGRLPDPALVGQWGVAQVAAAFGFAFTLAAPFVIVSVLYNLTLGIINRAMPHLMVVFVGAPFITGAALALLMLLAPAMIGIWATALETFLANPFGAR